MIWILKGLKSELGQNKKFEYEIPHRIESGISYHMLHWN